MYFKKATAKDVFKLIKAMNVNKAPGFDNIRAIDVRELSQEISPVIAKLINVCITSNRYPDELKIGTVRPIYKKGKMDDYNNYRPITILPVIDKIIEKYISKQIYSFYDLHGLINHTQYGFQPQKSTTELLSAFSDYILSNLNDKKNVLVVFIDYSKAFDTLRHDVLLDRLDDCGIRGPLLDWCRDYLANRSYHVKIGDALSRKVSVAEGTAQGSVMGPLHYITYVNNVNGVVKNCRIYQYADDTCLISAHRHVNTAHKLLQEDFTRMIQWSHDAGLVLNASKTKLMYISSSQNRDIGVQLKLIAHNHECLHKGSNTNNIYCKCPDIEVVDECRYLGLMIDNRFKWTSHIELVCEKLQTILAKLCIINHKVPHKILMAMYSALGESIVSYGLSSYGRTCKSHLDKIYNLQLRILKKIAPNKIRNEFRNDDKGLFSYYKTLPVHDNVHHTILKENYFKDEFNITRIYSKNTRQSSNPLLVTPMYNNLYGKFMLQYQVPTIINKIPKNIKDLITIQNYKYKFKQYFLEKLNV